MRRSIVLNLPFQLAFPGWRRLVYLILLSASLSSELAQLGVTAELTKNYNFQLTNGEKKIYLLSPIYSVDLEPWGPILNTLFAL